jgi:hypothetical protein
MYCCYDLYVDTSRELEQKRIKSKKIPAARFILPPPRRSTFSCSPVCNISELSLMCMSLHRPTGVAVLSSAYEASAGKWDLDRIIRGAHHLGVALARDPRHCTVNKQVMACLRSSPSLKSCPCSFLRSCCDRDGENAEISWHSGPNKAATTSDKSLLWLGWQGNRSR